MRVPKIWKPSRKPASSATVLAAMGDAMLLVAGASGGQAGAWDHNRQVEGELSSTHGGHGGGPIGEDGGTTPCNGDALGGGGANQEAAGAGGTSNRDYDLGQPGTGNALGGAMGDAMECAEKYSHQMMRCKLAKKIVRPGGHLGIHQGQP